MSKTSNSRRRKVFLIPALLLVAAALLFVPSFIKRGVMTFPQGPAITVRAVALDVLEPENPEHQVDLSEATLDTIHAALNHFAHAIDDAKLGLYSRRVEPVLTETRTKRMVKFSLTLALNNGSTLSSKMRWVTREMLGTSVSESVFRCMERYRSAAGGEDKALIISNI